MNADEMHTITTDKDALIAALRMQCASLAAECESLRRSSERPRLELCEEPDDVDQDAPTIPKLCAAEPA